MDRTPTYAAPLTLRHLVSHIAPDDWPLVSGGQRDPMHSVRLAESQPPPLKGTADLVATRYEVRALLPGHTLSRWLRVYVGPTGPLVHVRRVRRVLDSQVRAVLNLTSPLDALPTVRRSSSGESVTVRHNGVPLVLSSLYAFYTLTLPAMGLPYRAELELAPLPTASPLFVPRGTAWDADQSTRRTLSDD